jgi:hypothetical protein
MTIRLNGNEDQHIKPATGWYLKNAWYFALGKEN